MLDSPFPQPLSRSCLVFLLVWGSLLHTPCISSPNHHLFFASHAHTIAQSYTDGTYNHSVGVVNNNSGTMLRWCGCRPAVSAASRRLSSWLRTWAESDSSTTPPRDRGCAETPAAPAAKTNPTATQRTTTANCLIQWLISRGPSRLVSLMRSSHHVVICTFRHVS